MPTYALNTLPLGDYRTRPAWVVNAYSTIAVHNSQVHAAPSTFTTLVSAPLSAAATGYGELRTASVIVAMGRRGTEGHR
jgi:hypothetical protein